MGSKITPFTVRSGVMGLPVASCSCGISRFRFLALGTTGPKDGCYPVAETWTFGQAGSQISHSKRQGTDKRRILGYFRCDK